MYGLKLKYFQCTESPNLKPLQEVHERSMWAHAADDKAAPRGARQQLDARVRSHTSRLTHRVESREAGARGTLSREVVSKVHSHVNVIPRVHNASERLSHSEDGALQTPSKNNNKNNSKLKKEVEAEVTTVGSSAGGRGENIKRRRRTGAQN